MSLLSESRVDTLLAQQKGGSRKKKEIGASRKCFLERSNGPPAPRFILQSEHGGLSYRIPLYSTRIPPVFHCILFFAVFYPYSTPYSWGPFCTGKGPKISPTYSCRILAVFLPYSCRILAVYGIRQEYGTNTARIRHRIRKTLVFRVFYGIRVKYSTEYGVEYGNNTDKI